MMLSNLARDLEVLSTLYSQPASSQENIKTQERPLSHQFLGDSLYNLVIIFITDLTMFRTVIIAASRAAQTGAIRRPAPVFRALPQPRNIVLKQATPSWSFQAVRCYAAAAGLNKDEVTGRILELLKNFDKVGFAIPSLIHEVLICFQVKDTAKVNDSEKPLSFC
jgi:hypothetical protein